MTFDPNDHITKLPQGKDRTSDYLEVKWRLCWFRDQCAEGTIVTELVTLDLDRETQAEVYTWNDQTKRKEKVIKTAKGWCLFKATVTDGKGATATAHGSEGAADFGDYIEKAETKACGRALAYLGYGTQFAPELNEEHRIVDAPIDQVLASPAPKDYIPINTPTPKELRERHAFLKMNDDFNTIVFKLFKRKLTDGELTPEQCITISGVLERFYQSRSAKEVAS